jgi:hypothetical protein
MSDLTLFQGDNLASLEKASSHLSKSSLVPQHFRGKPAEVFSALVLGHSVGLNPMQSLLEIHVIQGRPAMSTKLMLALVQRKYPQVKLKWDQNHRDKSVSLVMKLEPTAEPYKTTWDVPRASSLNLMGRDQYKKQLMTMLQWRCLSEAIRFCAPDAVLGFYSIDEAQDLEPVPDEIRMAEEGKTEDELELGNAEYIFPRQKFRGKKMKDIPPEELEKRYDQLDARTTKKDYVFSQDDVDEINSIKTYLEGLE